MLPAPTKAHLEALAAKYEELAELRRARARGDAPAGRVALQRLAAAFPGALYELDTLPLETLDTRALELRRAAHRDDGTPPAPWMTWMHQYHALVRASLEVRRRGRDPRGPRPRATSVAIATLAAEAGVSPAEIERVLFARMRRGVSR